METSPAVWIEASRHHDDGPRATAAHPGASRMEARSNTPEWTISAAHMPLVKSTRHDLHELRHVSLGF
jgi:hypothetical protein